MPPAIIRPLTMRLDLPAPTVAALVAAGQVPDPEERAALIAAVELPEGEIAWTMPALMMLDVATGDGRRFASTGWGNRDLPLPFQCNLDTSEWGHAGALNAGRILTIGEPVSMGGGLAVPATGLYDDSDFGRDACRAAAAGSVRGVSADLEIFESDVTIVEDDEGWIESVTFEALRFNIMGATQTPFPAFSQCYVEVDGFPVEITSGNEQRPEDGDPQDNIDTEQPDDDEQDDEPDDEGDDGETASRERITIVAAGGRNDEWLPPADGFQVELDRLTPFTVGTDELPGHPGCVPFFGHLAPFPTDEQRTCHMGRFDQCLELRAGETGFGYFHGGGSRSVLCSGGESVGVGTLALYGGHYNDLHERDWRRVQAHYDDPATAGGYARVGEDEHGIWIAGFARPGLDPFDMVALRASCVSGDWRWIDDRLELIGVCCVNTPGWPVFGQDESDEQRRVGVAASGRLHLDGDRPLAVLAGAGTPALHRLKAEQLRPVTAGELAAMTSRIDELAGAVERMRRNLAPELRERELARLDP